MNNKVLFPLTKNKTPSVPKGTDWRDYSGEVNTPIVGVMIPNGVIVFDIDTYKDVTCEDVDEVLNVELDWESAELQRTMKGGMHYAFKTPFDVNLINDSDILGLAGFDTRSSGKGYIATGAGYENLTFYGDVAEALHDRDSWPELPAEVIGKLMMSEVVDEDNDLLNVIAAQPLDITEEDARMYLDKLPDFCAEDRSTWLKVSMAIAHQFGDTQLGYELFDNFCKRCEEKYDKRKNLSVWKSLFKSQRANPVKFASVIELAGGRDVIVTDKFEQLLNRAKSIDSLDDYEVFKKDVKVMRTNELGDDMRGMLAAEIANVFGKNNGLTKTEIKKALKAEKKPKQNDEDIIVPSWLEDWVYVESTCEFANTRLHYRIKREAFNAKYDRKRECVEVEKSAAYVALVDYKIPCVVDVMFWPSADLIFVYEGKRMLNTYYKTGVEPCDVLDADGQDVIERFLEHVRFTLEDEREQEILIDWLAFVYQNPDKRVNWALLLQGAEGTGKSYFVVLLQYLIGEFARNLDPMAINGRFTGWAHGSRVIAVEEIRISGTNKYETLDRMKPIMSNSTIQIEEKGRDHRTVPNFTSYLLLTNHKDAIPITANDRRYCVLFSRVQSEEQLYEELGGEKGAEVYFETLFDETERRADALAHYLANRKISLHFNAKGRAPKTLAKSKMEQLSVSPERDKLENAIEKYRCDVINEDIIDVTWLNKLAESDDFELPKQRAISAILLEMGYEQIPKRRIKINKTGSVHYLWIRCAKSKILNKENLNYVEVTRNFFEGVVPF